MNSPYSYIFLAEDDLDDQQLLCESFTLHGFSVLFEYRSDGLEALDFLLQCLPDHMPAVILLDYQMPKLPTPEILRTIRNDPRLKNIPKLVWSTSRNPADVEKCLQSGADKYLFKPVDVQDLDEIVRYLFGVYQQACGMSSAEV